MAAAETKPKDEKLKKMSFGDHLEELRRRLFISMATLTICVFGMLPFKAYVTKIYTAPYRFMWDRAYADHIAELEEGFASGVGPKLPEDRLQAADFCWQERKGIESGKYLDAEEFRSRSGFEKALVLPGQSGREAWLEEFLAYAAALEMHRDQVDMLIWNRRNLDAILTGEYPYKHLIKSKGGFELNYTLVAIGGLSDFWTFMAASLLFACIIASPVILWQVWAFLAAGLYRNERGVVHRSIPFALLLLACGVLFGYFLVVPYGFYFLTKIMDWAEVTPMFSVTHYFKFFLTLTVALGLVFQLPILMVALHKVGIMRHQAMRKHWRAVVLCFFVISAMLTPPDPFTQIMMVSPMLCLYVLGLFLTWRAEKKEQRSTATAKESAAASSAGGS